MHVIRRALTLSSLLSATAVALPAQAVSPADRANLEGSSYSNYPLGRFDMRFQQLHADLPAGAILSGHAYRRDAVQIRGVVDAFASDIEVTLSISSRDPSTASSTFADNVGPNPVTVLPRALIGFPATDRPALDPSPAFDLVIPYQVPFVMPASGGTLCVDTTIHGNQTAAGPDRNFSVYLDAHEGRTDGLAEQPGFRLGQGCRAPGRTATAYATLALWHLRTSMRLDVAMRQNVPLAQPMVVLGLQRSSTPWPTRPECSMLVSDDVWFAPGGGTDANGSFDGSLPLPLLPPGYRMFCQTGSIDLGSGALVLGDASSLMTQPAAPPSLPAVRIASASDRTSPTGTVSPVVTVTRFL
ncbi:MAG: hypothetical protein Fur0037_16450 [Planctomycetota bacterium]